MKNRVIIIFDHDIIGYPPTLSLINILLSLDKEVVFLGQYSDDESKAEFEKRGVQFLNVVYHPNYKIKNGILRKLDILMSLRKYQKEFFKIVDGFEFREDDLIWFIFSNKAVYMDTFLHDKDYIVQFYEFVDANMGGKYKAFYPAYDPSKLLQGAKKVVHCEYNRACIMNGMYGVKGKLNILPNKPYISDEQFQNIPADIQAFFDDIKKKIRGRKAILYQGIFNSNERRLEEFCQSMEILSDDYVFIAMGNGDYWNVLKERYVSDKYIFIPFIKPPYHLLVTQLANIGVLTYLPVRRSFADVINPLYCAPNKVYEYTKFGKPIICNDIPALRSIVEKFDCGGIVDQPMTPEGIARTIGSISNKYKKLAEGAVNYYDSIDMVSIVSDIIG